MDKRGCKRNNKERREEAKSKIWIKKPKKLHEQRRNEINYFLLDISPKYALKRLGQMTVCAEVRNNYGLLLCYFAVGV
jgi:hypothetical protein